MRALILVGPAGSGKTTLAGKIFRSNVLNTGRTAYVFNDDGTPDTVDAAILKDVTEFLPMNSGCFGCRDEAEFLKLLRSLKASGNYDWAVIEPLGFVEGTEVPNAVRRADIEPRVIALVDAEHFHENELLGIMPSQLRAANIGIGITKYPAGTETPFDPSLDEIATYIGRYAPGTPVFLVPKDEASPLDIVEVFSGTPDKTPHQHDERCEHGHESHDHSDEKDHGFYTYSFRLRKNASIGMLRQAVDAMPNVIRAKGIVNGRQFHRVHSTWQAGPKDDNPPFITLYARTSLDLHSFLSMVEPEEIAAKTTRQLLRLQMPREKTVRLIEFILQHLPASPLIGSDGPVTNPELHELLNEVRKRPEVPPELNAAAIRARVRYYVMTAHVFAPGTKWWNGSNAAKKKRDLAVGIGWFCLNRPKEVGDRLIAEARAIELATYLAEGLLGLESHNSDLAVALEAADETRDTAKFINNMDARLEAGFRHCLAIAEAPELKAKWREILRSLDITA